MLRIFYWSRLYSRRTVLAFLLAVSLTTTEVQARVNIKTLVGVSSKHTQTTPSDDGNDPTLLNEPPVVLRNDVSLTLKGGSDADAQKFEVSLCKPKNGGDKVLVAALVWMDSEDKYANPFGAGDAVCFGTGSMFILRAACSQK